MRVDLEMVASDELCTQALAYVGDALEAPVYIDTQQRRAIIHVSSSDPAATKRLIRAVLAVRPEWTDAFRISIAPPPRGWE